MTDIAEIRRANLRLIIKRDGLSSAAKRFGKPDRQINDMAAKRKSFGEKVARDMERAYDPSRPSGWLDLPPDQDRDPDHTPAPAVSPLSDVQESVLPPQSPVAPLAARWPFKHVDQRAYDALPAEGQIWVQGKLSAAIDEAARLFATATGKRSA